jgi:hypothetical protein
MAQRCQNVLMIVSDVVAGLHGSTTYILILHSYIHTHTGLRLQDLRWLKRSHERCTVSGQRNRARSTCEAKVVGDAMDSGGASDNLFLSVTHASFVVLSISCVLQPRAECRRITVHELSSFKTEISAISTRALTIPCEHERTISRNHINQSFVVRMVG